MSDKKIFNKLFNEVSIFNSNYLRSDVYEQDNKYIIKIDVPGINKDNINVVCENGYLKVEIKQVNNEEKEDKHYFKRERIYNKYGRQFYLGDIDIGNMDVSYKDGVLIVVISKNDITQTTKKQI